jgi:hypothetical protein
LNKLVYIAGPYSATTQLGVEANVTKAREAALWCVEHRIFYFCPHLNSIFFERWLPEVPVEFYYDMDICIAEGCDAALMVGTWDLSKGAVKEYHYFARANKPIFYWPNELDKLLSWHKGE